MDIIERIIGYFVSDTIELFDRVLDDDENDPQFSSVTTAKRIGMYLQYRKIPDTKHEISRFLLNSGYNKEDLENFWDKYTKEFPDYHESTLICDYGTENEQP